MNRSWEDRCNPIRNTESRGSKAYSDLRNLITRQCVNIEPGRSCDSSFPSFEVPPAAAGIPTVFHCYGPYAINFNLRPVVNHPPMADTPSLQKKRACIGFTKLPESNRGLQTTQLGQTSQFLTRLGSFGLILSAESARNHNGLDYSVCLEDVPRIHCKSNYLWELVRQNNTWWLEKTQIRQDEWERWSGTETQTELLTKWPGKWSKAVIMYVNVSV